MGRPKKTAEAVAPEKVAPLRVNVRGLWPNIWTSAGKLFRGDTANIPADEAEKLDSMDAVKILRAEQ